MLADGIRVLLVLQLFNFSLGAKKIHWEYSHKQVTKPNTTFAVSDTMGARLSCLSEIQSTIIDTFKDFLDGPHQIGYADPAANGNLGDQLLWAGSNKLFERFGKHPVLYCGGSQTKDFIKPCSSDAAKAEIKEKLLDTPEKGILWYNPGGNWGNLYRHVQVARFSVWEYASSLGIPFVSGPQSIYYLENSHAVKNDADYIKTIASKSDLLTFRQHNSFLSAQELYGQSATVRESPDMAFMLGMLFLIF